MRLAKGFHLNT